MPKSGYRDCHRLHRLTKILWMIKPTRIVQPPFYAARGSSVEKISTSAGLQKRHVTASVRNLYKYTVMGTGKEMQRGTDTASDCTLYAGKKKQRGTDTTMLLNFLLSASVISR